MTNEEIYNIQATALDKIREHADDCCDDPNDIAEFMLQEIRPTLKDIPAKYNILGNEINKLYADQDIKSLMQKWLRNTPETDVVNSFPFSTDIFDQDEHRKFEYIYYDTTEPKWGSQYVLFEDEAFERLIDYVTTKLDNFKKQHLTSGPTLTK